MLVLPQGKLTVTTRNPTSWTKLLQMQTLMRIKQPIPNTGAELRPLFSVTLLNGETAFSGKLCALYFLSCLRTARKFHFKKINTHLLQSTPCNVRNQYCSILYCYLNLDRNSQFIGLEVFCFFYTEYNWHNITYFKAKSLINMSLLQEYFTQMKI